MSKQTYYIVQISPNEYFHERGIFGGYEGRRGIKKAAQLDIKEATRLYNSQLAIITPDTPRRFPRIVKVTTEYKTIKERR